MGPLRPKPTKCLEDATDPPRMHTDTPPFVQLLDICKQYPPAILANDQVSMAVCEGEIHALLGENGAGKSTLMEILYGVCRRDAGAILIDGEPAAIGSPADAIALGIGMIHQEFMLVRPFTVVENVLMGTWSTGGPTGGGGRFDVAAAQARLARLSKLHGLDVDPRSRVEHLPIGVQQRVEILKLLYRDARLLILDEPTAVLTPQEVRRLFEVLRNLRAAGRSIILVTHKLREIMEIADRVTVLRDGRTVATVAVPETSERDLARLMVGRDVSLRVDKPPPKRHRRLFEVDNLEVDDHAGRRRVKGISLEVAGGEVLGIAGVDGNGQSDLIEALFGLRPLAGGDVRLNDQDITSWPTAARRSAGLAYIPADRGYTGSLPDLSIADNSIIGDHRSFARARGWFLDRARAAAHGGTLIERFGVRTSGVQQTAGTLSGGNLQKLVLGRELMRDPTVLLVEQPTRGLDVGAIELVWRELLAQRAAGKAILLVSAELEELLNLADRIAVIHDGRIMGTVAGSEADAETLGLMMAGATLTEARGRDRTRNGRGVHAPT